MNNIQSINLPTELKLSGLLKGSLIQDCMYSEAVIASIARATAYKLGDYLIADTNSTPVVYCGTNIRKKFKVVYVHNNGICYIQSLDRNGKLHGSLYCESEFSCFNAGYRLTFKLDPTYVDHVIMQCEDGYDPAIEIKEHTQRVKPINEYNKKVRIPLSNKEDVNTFLLKVKVGDILWKSNKKSVTITSINKKDRTITYKDGNKTITTVPLLWYRERLYYEQPKRASMRQDNLK